MRLKSLFRFSYQHDSVAVCHITGIACGFLHGVKGSVGKHKHIGH